MSSLRVATFNAHHGKQKNRPYSFDAMIDSIESLDADIICLQELDALALRTGFSHQPRMIAEHFGYHLATSSVRFFGLGYQHNSILSKIPIVSKREIVLPGQRSEQNRKALSVDVEHEGQTLTVTTAHLHSHRGRGEANELANKQLRFLLEQSSKNKACLIAGDLNLLFHDVTTLANEFGYTAPHEFPTSPADFPIRQIDWFLARDVYLEDVHTSDLLSSDHRALISSVTLAQSRISQ